jgi:trehalose-6-phosphatase
VEYNALNRAAQASPVTAALAAALNSMSRKLNIIVISGRNHDAEALAFSQHMLTARGYRLLNVDLSG